MATPRGYQLIAFVPLSVQCCFTQVARSSRLDPLLLLSIKDSRDTLERQLRQLTMAAPVQLHAARDAIDEATNLLMDLDAVLSN